MRFKVIDRETMDVSSDYELRFVLNGDISGMPDHSTLALCGFEKGSVCDLPTMKRIYVSITDDKPETLRLAIAKTVKALAGHKIDSIRLPKFSASEPGELEEQLAAIAEGFELSAYSFDKYKSKPSRTTIERVVVSVSGIDLADAEEAILKGRIIAGATNYVRDIVNEIPQEYNSLRMAEDAEDLAGYYGTVTCRCYDKAYLEQEGMNAFLAVNQAGPYEPRLIHLSYVPDGESYGRICFVGKGLTYDTGGLSLKPTSSMYTMKSDKSGAAAALGIIKAAAELELPYQIDSVLGVTENCIGNGAYKPDDVIRSRAGVTIEVTNTDAEGRLVLADCLSWAQDHIKPDLLIDLATLTGACVVGLGDYTSGVIGNNYDLQMEFKTKAQDSGENYTILEFNPHLEKILESKIADVKNSAPGTMGGAITAGLFLDKFIKDEYKDRWLHLDIAGPAYVGSDWGYNPAGASGAGVRGCIYFLMREVEERVAEQ